MDHNAPSSRECFVAHMKRLQEIHDEAMPALQDWLAAVETLFDKFQGWLAAAEIHCERFIHDCEDKVVGKYSTQRLVISSAHLQIDMVPISPWGGGPYISVRSYPETACLHHGPDGWSFELDPLTEDAFWTMLLRVLGP